MTAAVRWLGLVREQTNGGRPINEFVPSKNYNDSCYKVVYNFKFDV